MSEPVGASVGLPPAVGRVRRYVVDPLCRLRRPDADGLLLPPGWSAAHPGWYRNTVLKGWGGVVAPLLVGEAGPGPAAWVYVEYENGAPGRPPVVPPGYGRGRAAGVPYYLGLGGIPGRDFLRVPVVMGSVTQTDPDCPDGDTARLFAEAAPGVGHHGRPFSAAAGSVVFGFALVAGRGPVDRDVAACRVYLSDGEQVPCPAAGGVGVQWRVQFL